MLHSVVPPDYPVEFASLCKLGHCTTRCVLVLGNILASILVVDPPEENWSGDWGVHKLEVYHILFIGFLCPPSAAGLGTRRAQGPSGLRPR